MSDLLFDGFMSNSDLYLQSEQFWDCALRNVLSKCNPQHVWRIPWLNTRFANGEPFGDGNPIISGLCEELSLGIRIIQLQYDGEEVTQSWTDDTQFKTSSGNAVRVLTIACVATPPAVEYAMNTISDWLLNKC